MTLRIVAGAFGDAKRRFRKPRGHWERKFLMAALEAQKITVQANEMKAAEHHKNGAVTPPLSTRIGKLSALTLLIIIHHGPRECEDFCSG